MSDGKNRQAKDNSKSRLSKSHRTAPIKPVLHKIIVICQNKFNDKNF